MAWEGCQIELCTPGATTVGSPLVLLVSQPRLPCPADGMEDGSPSPGTITATGAVMGKCDVQVLPADMLMVACQGTLIHTLVAAQGSPNQLLQWWA